MSSAKQDLLDNHQMMTSFLIWIHIFTSLTLSLSTLDIDSSNYRQYTFYYETEQYFIHPPIDEEIFLLDSNHTNTIQSHDDNDTDSEIPHSTLDSSSSTFFNLQIDDNIEIEIIIEKGIPFEINIKNIDSSKEDKTISLQYEEYDNFNSIDIWHTPHRNRRRLATCTRTERYSCGRWGWSRCTRKVHYYCPPSPPPHNDPYWIHRFKRLGRYIAYYPGRFYNTGRTWWGRVRTPQSYKLGNTFHECSSMCRTWYGGMASINSWLDLHHAGHACYDITHYPHAKDQHNHNGNWRGSSCWIGLSRPFLTWNDKKPVTFKYWNPGEPNNGGLVSYCRRRERQKCGRTWWGRQKYCNRCTHTAWKPRGNEHCTEMLYNNRWNDLNCNQRRSCLCQDPRGQIEGRFIGVQAMKNYWQASQYCNIHYGTELATITNDEDNKSAQKLCARIAHLGSLTHCWIGLQRPFHEWDDGTNAEEKYENWYPGEPNNKNEKCTELYAEHKGYWNDLACWGQRYFLCNARTKIQRMDFGNREELIAKRMTRHRIRWQAFQAAAYRRKIRKHFFEQLKQKRALLRKHAREQQQKMREYYRQMAFSKLLSRNSGGITMGYRAMQSPWNAFDTNTKFGDNIGKRRRMREWLENMMEEKQSKSSIKLEKLRKKAEQKRNHKIDTEAIRNIDTDAMFYDEVNELLIDEDALKEADQDIPTPKRCIFLTQKSISLELCFNDDYLYITKSIKKIAKQKYDLEQDIKFDNISDLEFIDYAPQTINNNDQPYIPILNDTLDNDNEYDYYQGFSTISFDKFEAFRYQQASDSLINDDDEFYVRKLVNPHYLRSKEYIYDHEKNHKTQCFNDDKNGDIKICLQFNEDSEEMFFYIEGIFMDYISFDNDDDDNKWNEIQVINLMNDAKQNDKIQKCINLDYCKICLVKKLNIESYFTINKEYNEYRLIITKSANGETQEEDVDPYHDYF